jgi:hypothetical protein
VRADEKLIAFVELERAIQALAVSLISEITLSLPCEEQKRQNPTGTARPFVRQKMKNVDRIRARPMIKATG